MLEELAAMRHRSSNCPMTRCEALEGWAKCKTGLAACRNLAGKLYSLSHCAESISSGEAVVSLALCEACYAALERAPRASLEAARCFAAIRSSSLGRSSAKNELPGLKRCPTLISTGPSGAAIWIGFVQVQAPVCSR